MNTGVMIGGIIIATLGIFLDITLMIVIGSISIGHTLAIWSICYDV